MKPLVRLLSAVPPTILALLIAIGCRTVGPKSQQADHPHYPKSFTIVQQPESRIAQANSFVVFAVRVHPEHSAAYQWRFNGEIIKGATNRECFVRKSSIANVGTYSVEVHWPAKKVHSEHAFLSVYGIREANGIVGTMVIPAKAFKTASPFACATDSTMNAGMEYTPGDSEGTPFCFYGPEVPMGEQSGPFLNWTHLPNLRIDAAGNTGATRPTAVRFTENFNLKQPKDLACDADNGPDGPSIVRTNLAASRDPKRARYGVTLYKGGSTRANETVEFSWRYY